MSYERDQAIDIAMALSRFTESGTLDEMVSRVDHIDATKAVWLRAAVFLAAQLGATKRVSDSERARDAVFMAHQIEGHIKHYKERWP